MVSLDAGDQSQQPWVGIFPEHIPGHTHHVGLIECVYQSRHCSGGMLTGREGVEGWGGGGGVRRGWGGVEGWGEVEG